MLIAGRENEGMREPSQIHELYTFEHLMIHEWMHVDLFGYKEHSEPSSPCDPALDANRVSRTPVADIKGSIGHGWEGEFPIYGDKNCHYFAWKDHPNLNIEVALNGESPPAPKLEGISADATAHACSRLVRLVLHLQPLPLLLGLELGRPVRDQEALGRGVAGRDPLGRG